MRSRSVKTLQWYYRTLLSLVSVPLSSSSKETEGLNVFATVSQCPSHGRIPPPNNSKSKAPPTCFSTVPEASAPHTRCLWLGCHSFTLESDPEAAGAAEPFLPGLSARVASQPLVDDREDGMHQGQGRSRTWQQGCPCSGTQSAFPFLSVEHKVSRR